MKTSNRQWTDRLPVRLVPAPPGREKLVRGLRIAAVILIPVVLIIPMIQFLHGTMENRQAGLEWDRQVAAAEDPTTLGEEPKSTKGAIGRWRFAAREFWAGANIYLAPQAPDGSNDYAEHGQPVKDQRSWLHPNMPFTVILLSPFAYLPIWAMATVYTAGKIIAMFAVFGMLATVARHEDRKIPAWVLGLGIAWAITFVIGDIQHGNTNVYVLLFVALHLWAYRKGHDWLAGAPLAVAICIKMTPAIFVLYWLYRRNWKLLGGTVLFGLLFAVAV
ncbi:MAG: glycosyltransferase family 87 protein, partial [Planctomycetota bacterium]